MVEKLAIKSDRVGDWLKRKVNRLKGDLVPRKTESTKSSWAHVLKDSSDLPKVLACRPDACRELHALALFIFMEKAASERNIRDTIEGVSVDRLAFDPEDVIEDKAEHPINGYGPSHRSLKTKDQDKLEIYAGKIAEQGLFENWEYHISELRVRLRFLIEHGEITEEYRPAADQLLERWMR